MNHQSSARVFGLDDWNRWLNDTTEALFGMSGNAFRVAYASGSLADRGSARDVAAVLPLIDELQTSRERTRQLGQRRRIRGKATVAHARRGQGEEVENPIHSAKE